MTPSGWHDGAMGRDAGHDEMQAGVYRFLRDNGPKSIIRQVYNQPVTFNKVGFYFECPFFHQGNIVSFVDVCAHYREPQNPAFPNMRPDEFFICHEIKPKIYSVGAVMRQVAATENVLIKATPYHSGDRITVRAEVWAVVRNDDPKLKLLQEFCPQLMVWDQLTLTCAPYNG